MTKIKFLTISVIVLLVLNLGTITFLLTRRPPHPPRNNQEGPKQIIIDRLGFDKNQIEQYQKLINSHHEVIMELQNEIKERKNELYESLTNSDSSKVSVLEEEISYLQLEIEKTHYQHFKDIKALCKPDQLPKFNDLAKDLARLFKPGPGPESHP